MESIKISRRRVALFTKRLGDSRGQFFKTSVGANSHVGANSAECHRCVGASSPRRHENPFKKLASGSLRCTIYRGPFKAGLSDFLCYNTSRQELIYQMTTKYTNWPQNIPNDHDLYQHFPFQGPPKYTQIVIFWGKYTIRQLRFKEALKSTYLILSQNLGSHVTKIFNLIGCSMLISPNTL
jgi:hypothetical protein